MEMTMNNARRYSTADFAKALHHPLRHILKRERTFAAQDIPDEDVPLDALFTQIITNGLDTLYGKPRSAKIVIVGAGPAGLSAAYELKRAGMDVVLLEASQKAG